MRRIDTDLHLIEARDYIRSIANYGLDVSALFIAQAYLTKVQSSLKPPGAMEALFREEDLQALVQVCLGREVDEAEGQRIITEPLLKYFKITTPLETHSYYDHTTPTEVAHLMARILDSLEEWDLITAKANRLADRLEGQRRQRRESREVKRLEESLQAFLDKIMQPNHPTEFTTVESINQTCSIREVAVSESFRSEIGEQELVVSEHEVALFLGYLSMWMGQTLQEISELKAILDMAKSESSIDQDFHPTAPPNIKKGRIAKSSLLTSKIKQGCLDVPQIENNFFDQNRRPISSLLSGPKSVAYLKSEMSFNTNCKQERGGMSHRVTMGRLDLNREVRAKRSNDNCTSCEVY